MAYTAQYTEQVSVFITPAMKRRIDKIVKAHPVSQSHVIRETLESGIDAVEERYKTLTAA